MESSIPVEKEIPPTICLILPSLSGGGMERVMTELASYFVRIKKVDVHLVLLGKNDRFYDVNELVTIYEPDFSLKESNRYWHLIKSIIYLRKTIKQIHPQAVLSFGEMYNSLVLITTYFTTYKIFVSDRSKPDKYWGRLQEWLRKKTYRRAHGIIAQTLIAKAIMFERIGHPNIKVIGNPIKPMQVEREIKRENIVLTVGRMIKSKRHNLLLELFKRCDYRNWKLVFLGDGPERPFLEKLTSELALVEHVIFLGSHRDVESYYYQAKIFAFTSNSEGFPNALGEAMRSGLAPISFKFTAGSTDLIADGENGFLIPMDAEEEYVQKLNQLMQDETLVEQFGKKAKESSQAYDISVIGEKYYEFLLQ